MQPSEPKPQPSVLFWNVDLFCKPAPNTCSRIWCENQRNRLERWLVDQTLAILPEDLGPIPSTQMVVHSCL